MSFPPPPTSSIDWNKLGTKVRDEIGHVESRYSVHTGTWSEPEFVQDPYLRIHGLAPGLNYGQQAFEGMKGSVYLDPGCDCTSYKACVIAYRSPENQIQIFRPDFHAARMAHSAAFVSIPPLPQTLFKDCVQLAVAKNAVYVPPHDTEALLYIRPVVFGSSAEIALCPPEEFTFCVYVQPGHSYHGVRPLDALILEGFDRAAPNGTGTAKVGGNYAPVMRWSGKARSEGFGITLHLDSKTQTEIDEFSTSGFVGVRTENDSHTLVVPDSSSVIESVTSDSCLQVARSLGWKVEKRPIKYEELSLFSEVMAVGTAAALLPIKSITRKSTSDKFVYQNGADQPGPCTLKLSETIKAIQKGKIADQFGWCVRVDETTLAEAKVDVPVNGDGSVEDTTTEVAMVDADVKADEAASNEEPQGDAKTDGHAEIDEPKIDEQPAIPEKADAAIQGDERKTIEEAPIEEKTSGHINLDEAKPEATPTVQEKTDAYVGVEAPTIVAKPTLLEKLRGFIRVEETRVDDLVEVQ